MLLRGSPFALFIYALYISVCSPFALIPRRLTSTILGDVSSPVFQIVPKQGILEFDDSEAPIAAASTPPCYDSLKFTPSSAVAQWVCKFLLWIQPPWRKLAPSTVLKLKLGGGLSIESSPVKFSLAGPTDYESVDSLADLSSILMLGANDPRVIGILVDLRPLTCGYAKLKETRRLLDYFKQSGKFITGYAEAASEKEVYLAMGFSEFYMPPEGNLDLRGFSASATFFRGTFDKIGIEPQVQRIGKYKSFGDTFNRSSIAEPQREVLSSILTQASAHWAEDIAASTNNTVEDVAAIWAERELLGPAEYAQRGLITGVKYLDEVEAVVQAKQPIPRLRAWLQAALRTLGLKVRGTGTSKRSQITGSQFSATNFTADFEAFPRRLVPQASSNDTSSSTNDDHANTAEVVAAAVNDAMQTAKEISSRVSVSPIRQLRTLPGGLYLRKVRNSAGRLPNVPIREVRRGRRIAIINAAGGINSGESSRGGLLGPSVGAETLTALLRQARENPTISAVVLRVDSPGGSALASDLLWREIRLLSRVKPVVASQVDVAASGGYYLSMACDQIVAENLTLTGSIGVVTAKFNAEKLNEKIGLNTETLSIGRYAELFSTSRGFTEEEGRYFEDLAQKFYFTFVAKAAASRSMSAEQLEQVAQGRVWTGRQALQRGLVDHLGGLWTALQVADQLSRPNSTAPLQAPTSFRVQTLREPRSGFPSLSLLQSAIAVMLGKRAGQLTKVRTDEVQAVCAQAGLPGVVTGHQGALQGTIIQARQLWGNML